MLPAFRPRGKVGMVGINADPCTFGLLQLRAWKRSAFGDLNQNGAGIRPLNPNKPVKKTAAGRRREGRASFVLTNHAVILRGFVIRFVPM